MPPTLKPSAAEALHATITSATSGPTPALPGVIVHILDSNGSPLFSHTSSPHTPQTLFPIHSCSKLIGALAFLRLTSTNLAALDDPSLIASLLPELCSKKVLVGCETSASGEKEYVFEERKGDITARMLMNHTNGTGMSFFNAALRDFRGEDLATTNEGTAYFENLLKSPLLWQPGERTNYGQGFDWLSVLIERMAGKSLEDVLRENIFAPLGIEHGGIKGEWGGRAVAGEGVDFWPASLKMEDRSFMTLPGWAETKVEREDAWPAGKTHVQSVANGLVLSPADLARIYSVLLPQNGGVDPVTGVRILSPAAAAEVARLQHPEEIRNNSRDIPSASPIIMPYASQGEHVDPEGWFGLGAAVQGADRKLPDGRKGRSKGSVYWHGASNAEYWVDGERGIVVVVVSNFFPFMDGGWVEFVQELEGRIYEGLEGE